MDESAKEVLKYLIVILAAPAWIPFIRALGQEIKLCMREEGGFLGKTPNKEKLEEIRREIAREESPLISEPLAHLRVASGPKAAPGRGGDQSGGGGGFRR